MKKKIFLEGKEGGAARARHGFLPRAGIAVRGTFTFEEKRTTDLSHETRAWAREGAA
jgi:hypothetical protein